MKHTKSNLVFMIVTASIIALSSYQVFVAVSVWRQKLNLDSLGHDSVVDPRLHKRSGIEHRLSKFQPCQVLQSDLPNGFWGELDEYPSDAVLIKYSSQYWSIHVIYDARGNTLMVLPTHE